MEEQIDRVIEAAGGIVERRAPDGPLIAVIRRARYGSEWALPKGKRDTGESWQQTALREVMEEIGVQATIVGVAGATAYDALGKPKIVLYWRMHVQGSPRPFVPNNEVLQLEWLRPEAAAKRLSHAEEAQLLSSVFPIATTSTIDRIAMWLDRRLIPILRRRAWKRLSSAVVAYRREVEGRADLSAALTARLPAIREALDSANAALGAGNIDEGWKCLQVAQRMELLCLDPFELGAVAATIREEADKLNAWRKSAVVGLLGEKDTPCPDPYRVFRAAHIRDEHYNNEAYKDGLRRSSAFRLATIMFAAIVAMLWLAHDGFFSPQTMRCSNDSNCYLPLLSVALMGLLGSTVSAVTDFPRAQSPSRIPEMISTFQITALRLLMGPASAIVVYFVANSALYDAVIRVKPEAYTLLAMVFVAGFTERLILRVVEAFAGQEKK